MPTFESSPTLTGAELHGIITNHAQCYVYGSESVENIHASMMDYADSYRGDYDSIKDEKFETIQRMRIGREAILAALGRVIGDEIISKALTFADGETLDIAQMTKNIKPTYSKGMMNFLDETIDEAMGSLADLHHPHHDLLYHALDVESNYLPLLGKGNKKMGSMNITPNAYFSLTDMFVANYHNDIASFLVTHGIGIQDQYDGLPDAETIVKATEQARPHWLTMATLSRIHVGNLYYGKERYKRILEVAAQEGAFPTWSTLWPEGMDQAAYDNQASFATCPMESPLIHRAPQDPIVDRTATPHRCAGQIELYGSPEANKNAIRLSKMIGNTLTETGRYSPAALLVDLGRTASRLSFNDPQFRKALIDAKYARDESKLR